MHYRGVATAHLPAAHSAEQCRKLVVRSRILRQEGHLKLRGYDIFINGQMRQPRRPVPASNLLRRRHYQRDLFQRRLHWLPRAAVKNSGWLYHDARGDLRMLLMLRKVKSAPMNLISDFIIDLLRHIAAWGNSCAERHYGADDRPTDRLRRRR